MERFTEQDLRAELAELKHDYDKRVHEAKMKWARANKRFDKGDIIYSTVGIIRVESFGYFGDFAYVADVSYTGQTYKRIKGGKVIRTKAKKKKTLIDYDNDVLKLVPKDKID